MTVQEKFGFRRLINARGPATILGAARVEDDIRNDIYDILGESAEIWELQRRASEKIAQLTGAEAGCVVNCSSAGMAVATAAVLTGNDPYRIKALPDITWPKKKIVIQKGQVTGAGDCPVWQVIKMTGAEYVEIRAALDDTVAAAFYIMEDTFAPNLLPLETFVSICKEKEVPVICDAAYLTDFKMLANLGVDLAIYSGQKWLGGCTSGMVAGRKDLVQACYMQEMGIGRPMKVGKEGIVSIMSSIDHWMKRDTEAVKRYQTDLAMTIIKEIKELEGVSWEIKESLYSPSVRLHVTIDEKVAKLPAWVINDDMGRLDPVIKTDDYYVNHGLIIFDLAYMQKGDDAIVGEVLKGYLTGTLVPKGLKGQENLLPRTRQDILYDVFNQWLEGDPRK